MTNKQSLMLRNKQSLMLRNKTNYPPSEFESKWVKEWEKAGLYKAVDFDKKPKFYLLVEFPYPSAAGLHVGSLRSWAPMDAYARKKRMQGFNVLYPFGWDAFGLPAENYAIKMGVHPSKIVPQNIAKFKQQCRIMGLSFDWNREVDTTDPKYYKWTQWIFLKLFEKGLAYQAEVPVNWCPFCKTNLADEEVLADGAHERCGNQTERRMQKQWVLKITAYAQRLLDDLNLVDYSPKIRIQQENWIGRSEGVEIDFPVAPKNPNPPNLPKIRVFTTRPDTLFGVTAVVISPEHSFVSEILSPQYPITRSEVEGQTPQIKVYIEKAKSKSELERIENKEKTGVFTGLYCINPINNESIPVWIGDYVIGSYGGGAVMVVPAHDQRDYDFAKKYGLEIRTVVSNPSNPPDSSSPSGAFESYGTLVNSGNFSGQTSEEAKINITKWLEKHQAGKTKIQFHLRDWIFSRQHYWGEPIPIVYCPSCALKSPKSPKTLIDGVDYAIILVPEKDLPVELPYVEKYQPSGTGESPLANVESWVKVACPQCGEAARRETDTMPNWAGSNWYYVAYLFASKLGNSKRKTPRMVAEQSEDSSEVDNRDKNIFTDNSDKLKYWLPVDLYEGGYEHTTLHLLYSRFIYKFLSDIGAVPTPEPYKARRSHGIVLGADSRKMSKSFGNVVNPDEIVKAYGADALRVYESFMGPFDQMISWSEEGVEGCYRFLKRVWSLSLQDPKLPKTPNGLLRTLHKTIRKVGDDIDNMKFNTAVAAMMEFVNAWKDEKEGLSKEDLEKFLLILAPFAPFITEELWQNLVAPEIPKAPNDPNFISIHSQSWPEYDKSLLEEEEVIIVIQVNGKVRGQILVQSAKCKVQSEVEELAKQDPRVLKYLEGKEIKKVIFVPGKLINFVI